MRISIMFFDHHALTEIFLAFGALCVFSAAYITLKGMSAFFRDLELNYPDIFTGLGRPDPFGRGENRGAAWDMVRKRTTIPLLDDELMKQVRVIRSFYRMTWAMVFVVVTYSFLSISWIMLGGQDMLEKRMTQKALNPALEAENECIGELLAFETIFGISRDDLFVLESSCRTCKPFGKKVIHGFEALVRDVKGQDHMLIYYYNCPKQGHKVKKTCISSHIGSYFYDEIKEHICLSLDEYERCMMGAYESVDGDGISMSLEKHAPGFHMDERPYIEWNMSGNKKIGYDDCFFGWVPDQSLGRPPEWDYTPRDAK